MECWSYRLCFTKVVEIDVEKLDSCKEHFFFAYYIQQISRYSEKDKKGLEIMKTTVLKVFNDKLSSYNAVKEHLIDQKSVARYVDKFH